MDNFYTSKVVNTSKRGGNYYDINLRSTLGFREIGKGLTSMKLFYSITNIPPPIECNYLRDIYVKEAQVSMKKAADEVTGDEIGDDGVKHCTVSFDGTWQRRGYPSLNGVVVACAGGKVIDTETLAKQCNQCKYWGKRLSTDEFKRWKLDNSCCVNHTKSAGTMESAGALKIINRSIATNNMRYTSYLGDGNSKSFSDIMKADPYPGYLIQKKECVGHVQKRVGTRQKNLIKSWSKGPKGRLSDGKGLTGDEGY